MMTQITPTRILIADDHRLFNDSLANALEYRSFVIRQAFDGLALLHAIRKEMPDLLLLDINLPKCNGIEAAEKIRHSYPELMIIVVSMHNQEHLVAQVKALGLEGYVLKDSPFRQLMEAIVVVLQGGTYFDPKLHTKLADEKDEFSSLLSLTQREMQVAQLLADGKKAIEIAKNLGVTYETVKSHRKNIYLKLGVNTLLELSRSIGNGNN